RDCGAGRRDSDTFACHWGHAHHARAHRFHSGNSEGLWLPLNAPLVDLLRDRLLSLPYPSYLRHYPASKSPRTSRCNQIEVKAATKFAISTTCCRLPSASDGT